MFINFFDNLRKSGIPVSLREYLTFLEAISKNVGTYEIENFYILGRTIMVKDERHLDRFDRAFSHTFNGLDELSLEEIIDKAELPSDWLKKLAEKHLSKEEMAEIKSLGGLFVIGTDGAEYILKWLPIGTHDWEKFVKPEELKEILSKNNLFLKKLDGMHFNIIKDEWSITNDLSINYIAKFLKN